MRPRNIAVVLCLIALQCTAFQGTVFGMKKLTKSEKINYKMTPKNNFIIDGNNRTLSFKKNGKIVIKKNTTITMQNITIKGNSIEFKDQTSILKLTNARWDLNKNYTLPHGTIICRKKVIITKQNGKDITFIYQGPAKFQIEPDATTIFKNIDLSFENKKNKTPIEFLGKTSVLNLKDSKISLFNTTFKKGILKFSGDVLFSSRKRKGLLDFSKLESLILDRNSNLKTIQCIIREPN